MCGATKRRRDVLEGDGQTKGPQVSRFTGDEIRYRWAREDIGFENDTKVTL